MFSCCVRQANYILSLGNSPRKWPVTRKCIHVMTSSCNTSPFFPLSNCCQTVLEDFVTSIYQIQGQLITPNTSVGCNYLDHCFWDARCHMATEIAGLLDNTTIDYQRLDIDFITVTMGVKWIKVSNWGLGNNHPTVDLRRTQFDSAMIATPSIDIT